MYDPRGRETVNTARFNVATANATPRFRCCSSCGRASLTIAHANTARAPARAPCMALFEDRGWLSPPAWAVLASFYPVRAAYSYLKRLHRWKLLDRTLDRRGLLLYRLSRRGVDRLDWLRRRAPEGDGLR